MEEEEGGVGPPAAELQHIENFSIEYHGNQGTKIEEEEKKKTGPLLADNATPRVCSGPPSYPQNFHQPEHPKAAFLSTGGPGVR